MSPDFRTLLTETERTEDGERWFDDLKIGGWFFLSVQASACHDSKPMALLDDLHAYEAFDLKLQTLHGIITAGKWGVWEDLSQKPWASLFTQLAPSILHASAVPTATVQRIYDDLTAFAATHRIP